MEFFEKAGIRMDHWLSHSESHAKEYESFAQELEAAGFSESAADIRTMAALTRHSTEHLRAARQRLKKEA